MFNVMWFFPNEILVFLRYKIGPNMRYVGIDNLPRLVQTCNTSFAYITEDEFIDQMQFYAIERDSDVIKGSLGNEHIFIDIGGFDE